jgi:hypothetical protein
MEPILGGCVQGGGIGPAGACSAENAEERNSRTVAGQGMAHSGG